jgi:RNA polymerase sigma factor (sigma-70 family)
LFQRCLQEQTEELWRRFQKHYQHDLERIVRRAVCKYHQPRQVHDIEDLMQDLFCSVLASRRKFVAHSDRQLWAYLSQIVCRRLIDRYRRARFPKKRLRRIGKAELHWLGNRRGADDLPTPEEVTVRRDAWRQLAALASLVVHPQRSALEMRALRMALIEGYSSREIAQATDLKAHRVDRLVFRLRKKMATAGMDLPYRFTLASRP